MLRSVAKYSQWLFKFF